MLFVATVVFLLAWHNLDNAYNVKRMNLFMESQGIGYQMSDNGMMFNFTSESAHIIGMILQLLALAFFFFAAVNEGTG